MNKMIKSKNFLKESIKQLFSSYIDDVDFVVECMHSESKTVIINY